MQIRVLARCAVLGVFAILSLAELSSQNPPLTLAYQLTHSETMDPSLSPDGTKIAFASNRNRNYEIYIMNPDGSDVRKVANSEGRATAPQWGKDGKTIYFPICKKVDFKFDCEIYAAKLDAFSQ